MSATTIKPGRTAAHTITPDYSYLPQDVAEAQTLADADFQARLDATENRAGLPYMRLFNDQPKTVKNGCFAFATDDDKLTITADHEFTARFAVECIDAVAAKRGIARPDYTIRIRPNR